MSCLLWVRNWRQVLLGSLAQDCSSSCCHRVPGAGNGMGWSRVSRTDGSWPGSPLYE